MKVKLYAPRDSFLKWVSGKIPSLNCGLCKIDLWAELEVDVKHILEVDETEKTVRVKAYNRLP